MSKTKNDPSQGIILPFSYTSKLSFICLGSTEDPYFQTAVKLYQELLDVSGQKGFLFIPKRKSDVDYVKKEEKTAASSPLSVQSITDLIAKMCETNFKQFEAVLKCGGYFKLESLINIWPPPLVSSSAAIFRFVTKKFKYLSAVHQQRNRCHEHDFAETGDMRIRQSFRYWFTNVHQPSLNSAENGPSEQKIQQIRRSE